MNLNLSVKKLLTVEDEKQVVEAIRRAERASTGEVRVFIEEFCPDEPLVRVAALFAMNGMDRTRHRNGVLIYLSWGTREMAIWGDEGIHERVGPAFWALERDVMRHHFRRSEFATGLCHVIDEVGERLAKHFPAEPGDVNELPDEIIYG